MNLFEKLFKRTKPASQASMTRSASHGNMLDLASGRRDASNSSSKGNMLKSASHGNISKLFSQLKRSKPSSRLNVQEMEEKLTKFRQAETLFRSALKINAEDEKSIKDEKLKINEELNIQTSKIIAASKNHGDIIKLIKTEICQWDKKRQENIIIDAAKQSELNQLKAERMRNYEPIIEEQTEQQALFISWNKNFKEVEESFFSAILDILDNAKTLNLKKSKVREKLLNLNEITKSNSIQPNLKKKKSVSFSESVTSFNSEYSRTNETGILFQSIAVGNNIENSNNSWKSQSFVSNLSMSESNEEFDEYRLNITWDSTKEFRFE